MNVIIADHLNSLSHVKMQNCVNFWRYIMLLFLCLSMSLTLIVLGLDLDWLINGPAFMARIFARIKER